jgi:hypothetical protein
VIGKLPAFFAEWYARLGELLDGRRQFLAHANTWGDGLYLVTREDPCDDRITAFTGNGSHYPASPLALNGFMAEAEIIKNYQSPYAVLSS